MKHYFLGLAAGYSPAQFLRHTFTIGTEVSRKKLRAYLVNKYMGEAYLTKNGRSALAIALKAYFNPGDAVIVNSFTCFAVYEALQAAEVIPVWADITSDDLNFTVQTLKDALKRSPKAKGIIIQNSLGYPVDMAKIEHFCQQHNLTIIEDLAHSAGVKYPDGREAGTVGAATVLSFGKDKSVDSISGGAVVLRHPYINSVKAPHKQPRVSDTLRARFYPLFGLIARIFSYFHLSGVWMRLLLKLHWIEKSADSSLDLERKIAKFEASCALYQMERLPGAIEVDYSNQLNAPNKMFNQAKQNLSLKRPLPIRQPLRRFYLVRNRDKVLNELQQNGYYFANFWYETPVSPRRYYKKVAFPEKDCPVATKIAKQIINFPAYYSDRALAPARVIVEKYEIKPAKTTKTPENKPKTTENPSKSDQNSPKSSGGAK